MAQGRYDRPGDSLQAESQSKDREHSLVSVYIPTIPNPTSGNMAFVNEDDVMETDISVDDCHEARFLRGIRTAGQSCYCPRTQNGH